MKRFWVAETNEHCSPSPESLIDSCAICRGLLVKKCIDCEVKHQEEEGAEPTELVQTVWFTLLLMRNRAGTLFSRLDAGTLALIMNYAFPSSPIDIICDVAYLECGHVFHSHCFAKWYAKREVCPLDNLFVDPNSSRAQKRKIIFSTKLVSVFNSEAKNYDEVREREKNIRYFYPATIISILKYTPEGASAKTLADIIGINVDSILSNLQERGFVIYSPKRGVYFYH